MIAFEYVGRKLGASADECEFDVFPTRPYFADVFTVKLTVSFLLSYPLAGLLKRIPDSKPAYKNLFIIGLVVRHLY